MATIKLTRVKCKNLTTKEDMWRLGVKSIGNVSAEDFVKHAAEHCDVKVGTLRAAMAAFVDSAKLFLSMGHGVQLGDLGTLQLSVTSKATKLEKDLTAKNLTGVNVNLRPIGDLAKEIKNFKFSVVGAVNEEEDDNTGTIDPSTGDDSGSNPPSGVTYTFRYSDGTEATRSGETGESVNAPVPNEWQKWFPAVPATFGSENKTFTAELDASLLTAPTDTSKVKLYFVYYDKSTAIGVAGTKEVEPGYTIAKADAPEGYVLLSKDQAQNEINGTEAGGFVTIDVAKTA